MIGPFVSLSIGVALQHRTASFFNSLFALAIVSHVVTIPKESRHKVIRNGTTNLVQVSRSFWTALILSFSGFIVHILLAAYKFSFLHLVNHEFVFSAGRSSLWLAIALALLAARKRGDSYHLLTTRVLFISNIFVTVALSLLSAFRLLSGQHRSHERNDPFSARSIHALTLDDLVTLILDLPLSLYFGSVGFSGLTGVTAPMEPLSQPLLDSDSVESGSAPPGSSTTTPYVSASLFSRATFLWIAPVLALGSSRPLETSDVPSLGQNERAEENFKIFDRNWLSQARRRKKVSWGAATVIADQQEQGEHVPLLLGQADIGNGHSPDSPPSAAHPKATAATPTTSPSVTVALWATYSVPLVFTGVLALLKTAVMYAGPLLLSSFVDFATAGHGLYPGQGYVLVAALFLAKAAETVLEHQYNFQAELLGLNMRSALVGALYSKSLRLSSKAKQNRTAGEIVNLMATDAQRLADLMWELHNIWVLPLQILCALVILFHFVGPSMLAGLTIMLSLMLLNLAVAHRQQASMESIMTAKDARMKATSEALGAMKAVKLYGWQTAFLSRVEARRASEFRHLSEFMYVGSLNIFLLWLSPLAVSVATFAAMAFLGRPLTPAAVFTAIATFRILQEPLRSFPNVISGVLQAFVSLKRLTAFLHEEELQEDAVAREEEAPSVGSTRREEKESGGEEGAGDAPSDGDPSPALVIENASFSWEGDASKLSLSNVSVSIKKGSRVAVCGTVGAGKSTVLSCVLGEVPRISGKVFLSGSTAYVPQVPWIQNGTIQENILFGTPLDRGRYNAALRCCCLLPDLQLLPAGDATEIGERGVNLSGGQKQRIQLARAVYADREVYLLDDPFSAVDAHTGSQLFMDCVLEALAGKTIILVTHQVEFLPAVDLILVMKDGEVVQSGKYDDLLKSGTDFSSLVDAHNEALGVVEGVMEEGEKNRDEKEALASAAGGAARSMAGSGGTSKQRGEAAALSPSAEAAAAAFMGPSSLEGTSVSRQQHRHLSPSALPSPEQEREEEELRSKKKQQQALGQQQHIQQQQPHASAPTSSGSGQLISEEERETGRVGPGVYWAYITKSMGGRHVPLLLLVQLLWQLSQIASDWWLANYTSPSTSLLASSPSTLRAINETPFPPLSPFTLVNSSSTAVQPLFSPLPLPTLSLSTSVTSFLHIYALLALSSAAFVFVRTLLVSWAGLHTTQSFFTSMIRSIFSSPMAYFDSTPLGRILSRSSTDQSTLDMDLPFEYGSLLAMLFQLLGILFVTSYITWPLIFAIVPMAYLYLSYQHYYLSSSRELSRLNGITKSPIINHFSETLSGAHVVRAFGASPRFLSTCFDRTNTNNRVYFHYGAATLWLGVQLEIIGAVLLALSALLLVSLPPGIVTPGLAGMSLSYGLALSQGLFYVVWIWCSLENAMVSVERIMQYSTLPQEKPLVIPNNRPGKEWPQEGAVTFDRLELRYRPDLPLVLKSISASICGGEKIGIVGRTGSGKSSLVAALFRLVEPCGGRILIDGQDVCLMGLGDLRSRLSIIPQEPTLFEGTVRYNLDPLQQYKDLELWEALDKCQLGNSIRDTDEKLGASVSEGGDNWSMGQRQLFCLARALLRCSRVLVLDEATASVDTATDAVIQRAIRESFCDATVIAVAHRIPSVIDSDRVMVMEKGRLVEYDSPVKLLENKSSLFSFLVSEYSSRSSDMVDLARISSVDNIEEVEDAQMAP